MAIFPLWIGFIDQEGFFMLNESLIAARDGTLPADASADASEGLSTAAYPTESYYPNLSSLHQTFNNNKHLPSIRPLPLIRTYEGAPLVELEGIKGPPSKLPFTRKRGQIGDFSKDSRYRLMKLMAKINGDKAGLPTFLTLTYPAEWSEDWRVWKRDLDAFRKAVVRRWPNVWGPWRLEFQKRGAPHFHLLLWDGPELERISRYDRKRKKVKYFAIPRAKSGKNAEIFDWFSETWYRIVDSGDKGHLQAGTKVEPLATWGGVVHYVSKYLAKLPEGNFVPVVHTGRFWGVIQKEKWKIEAHEMIPPEIAWFRARRVFEKWRRLHGAKRRKLQEKTNLTTYINFNDSARVIEWALASVDDPGRRAPF
jgi:hypothetical protein